ncbi:TPA: hypothetical protein NJ339_004377 [Vibrio parahaemolyticus]|uniref:hypothetical protein n=2 Tax=Vibrio parahaemolyticus TaxID=670 RepID=UPI00111CF960|nr:hypothetical protein [Vibrio parahaemolyticus]TOE71543.1 hypothetical protein CGJ36_23150 [Vibrio parahaemolyticus]HCG7078787.1 hypothetical protein [Vibrio parahaemolyticus]
MLSEFEEKQYEQHLNIELLQGSNLIFPPGQHLENVLGFDAALFTRNKNFWRHFLGGKPWYRLFFRSYLNGMYFPKDAYELEDAFNNDFPQFKFNAFIQHKRPERMVKDTAAEWGSWHQEYYRYKLLDHQQSTLEILEKNVGEQGVVTYASPAFHTKQEFWNVHKSRSFIQNSNFCQPSKLIGHKAYTYISAGTSGIAHSEPEKVESYDLISEIERLAKLESDFESKNTDFVSNTCELIESTLEQQGNYKDLYFEIVSDLDKHQQNSPKLLRDLYRLSVYKFVTGTNLYFGVGDESRDQKIQRTNYSVRQ